MTERSDFVFEGRKAETRVHTVGCSARFAAWLPDGEHGVADSGGVAYAGTWVVDVGGEVPNGTYELSFIPGRGHTFLDGDAAHGRVLPVTYGATIQLGEPAIYAWLKIGLAAVVGLLLGAFVGYGLWRRSRRPGTDRPA